MNLKLIVLLFFFIPCNVFAQDPAYSQFFANPLHLNPAFAGTTELARTVLNYRNQWPQNGNSFTTYALSYDFMLKKRNAGLGIQIYYDKEPNNVVTTSSVSFAYSYHLTMGPESFVTLGLDAGFVMKQFDPDGLVFPSNIDQLSGVTSGYLPTNYNETRKSYPDFAIGAVGQHRNWFWGASVHHITQPDESIFSGDQKGNLPAKVTLHAGTRTRKRHRGLLSRPFTLSPNILYQQQGSFKQLNLGIYMIEKSLLFGGWFRSNFDARPDAVVALIGFAKEKFQFGYSFDYTLSELSNFSHGSHELSLTFFLGQKSEIPIRNKLLVPMI